MGSFIFPIFILTQFMGQNNIVIQSISRIIIAIF